LATKKSIWAIIGLILILAVWEVNGTLVERHNVLHEEGADTAQHATVQGSVAPSAAPTSTPRQH
jgi:hypothetical protein